MTRWTAEYNDEKTTKLRRYILKRTPRNLKLDTATTYKLYIVIIYINTYIGICMYVRIKYEFVFLCVGGRDIGRCLIWESGGSMLSDISLSTISLHFQRSQFSLLPQYHLLSTISFSLFPFTNFPFPFFFSFLFSITIYSCFITFLDLRVFPLRSSYFYFYFPFLTIYL